MKKILALALSVCAVYAYPQFNQAQQNQQNSQDPVPAQRSCGTPTLPLDFENWVQSKMDNQNMAKGPGGGNNVQSIFNIPVIVHIIHNNEAVNTVTATSGGNLNAAQVIDQINILNRDFNGTNPDTNLIPNVFKPLLGKFQVNFCLAVVNPTGGVLAEPGIDRINRSTMGWNAPPYSQNYYNNTIKAASIWNPNRYFNIWVSALSGGLLGYATFPDPVGTGLLGLNAPYGNATTDGVVILNTAFGSIGTASLYVPYNKGRTATHEVGHWMGLRHIWGDANCGNDYCNDTPTQQASNGGCPGFPKISCNNGPNGEMHMNYMDYTNDACMYMFSADQKYRAQLIMANSPIRVALGTSTVCNLPSIGNDIGINFVVAPTYSQVINCSNKITPVINLRNYGTTTITTATVVCNVDGANTQTLSWSGSLAPSTATNYTLAQFSNLVNGPHVFNATVTAPNGGTDNNSGNNIDAQQFTIANSFTLTANSVTACLGQSVTLIGSGGAASYSWNPGAIAGATAVVSPTTTTIYTLTGTSGTCVNTFTTAVTVSGSSLTISVNNPTICTGSSATVTASGAANYTWSTGAFTSSITVSPGATTVYTVSGTVGSCSGSKTATVTVNNIIPVVTLNNATICAGNAAVLSASGAATYSWSTGAGTSSISISPTVTSAYTTTGTTLGCSTIMSATVTVSPAMNPVLTSTNASCGGCTDGSASVSVSGGVAPYQYAWQPSGGNAALATDLLPGCYTVTITDALNCVKTAFVCVQANSSTGISTHHLTGVSAIYPNPASSEVIIEFISDRQRSIGLTDVTGRLMLSEATEGQKVQLNLSQYSSGVYYIRIKDDSGQRSFKLLKD